MLRQQYQAGSLFDFGLVLLLGILWGLPYALTKLSLASIPPLTLVAARVFLAAAVLWIAALALGRKMPWSWKFTRSIAVQGCVACVIPYTLIAFGQRSVDSSLAAILNSTTPLFVCLIGAIWTRHESITAGRLFGAAIGLGGVVTIAGVSALAGLGQETIGQAAILLATVSSAVSAIYGRRFAEVAPEVTAACVLSFAAVLLLPPCLIVETPWHSQPSLVSLAALLANAVVATALGFVVYFRLIRTVGSMGTASAGYLKPGIGVLIGCTLLGENLTWTVGAGLLAVLVGVVAINGKISHAPLLAAVGRASRRFKRWICRRTGAPSAAQG